MKRYYLVYTSKLEDHMCIVDAYWHPLLRSHIVEVVFARDSIISRILYCGLFLTTNLENIDLVELDLVFNILLSTCIILHCWLLSLKLFIYQEYENNLYNLAMDVDSAKTFHLNTVVQERLSIDSLS